MTTPRVARAVVSQITELLTAAGADSRELDTLVADAVNNLRRAASVADLAVGTAAEQEFVRTLVLAKTLVLACCPTAYDGWNFEEWSALLCGILVAAVSSTQAGQSYILRNVQDEDRWTNAVKAVLEEAFDIKKVVTGPWQATRRWLVIWLWTAGILCALPAYLFEDLSGRTKFYLAFGASCGFTLGVAWRRRGNEQLFSRTEVTYEPTSPLVRVYYPEIEQAEAASVSSAPATLAAENEALKTRVKELEGLQSANKDTLIMFDYKRAGTQVPPRTLTLTKELPALESISALQPGTTSELSNGMKAKADDLVADNACSWHSRVPSDLNRASPEIYRSMRASGAASVRDFISQLFAPDQRSSQVFTELFTAASGVDFTLANQKTEEDILASLSSDDLIEMSLRKIAAYLHQKRTGDTSSADYMLAVKPPGLMTDIAPTWLAAGASAHSKQEFQQQERGRKGGGRGQQYPVGCGDVPKRSHVDGKEVHLKKKDKAKGAAKDASGIPG